jgi:hypothetical protein
MKLQRMAKSQIADKTTMFSTTSQEFSIAVRKKTIQG